MGDTIAKGAGLLSMDTRTEAIKQNKNDYYCVHFLLQNFSIQEN